MSCAYPDCHIEVDHTHRTVECQACAHVQSVTGQDVPCAWHVAEVTRLIPTKEYEGTKHEWVIFDDPIAPPPVPPHMEMSVSDWCAAWSKHVDQHGVRIPFDPAATHVLVPRELLVQVRGDMEILLDEGHSVQPTIDWLKEVLGDGA